MLLKIDIMKVLLVGFFLLSAVSCDPCKQLAEKICDCHEQKADKDTCLEDVRLIGSEVTVTKEHQEVCKKALETCTCEGIRNQEIDKCGMTRSK